MLYYKLLKKGLNEIKEVLKDEKQIFNEIEDYDLLKENEEIIESINKILQFLEKNQNLYF